jgi:hypothetical protein
LFAAETVNFLSELFLSLRIFYLDFPLFAEPQIFFFYLDSHKSSVQQISRNARRRAARKRV